MHGARIAVPGPGRSRTGSAGGSGGREGARKQVRNGATGKYRSAENYLRGLTCKGLFGRNRMSRRFHGRGLRAVPEQSRALVVDGSGADPIAPCAAAGCLGLVGHGDVAGFGVSCAVSTSPERAVP